MPQKFFFPGRRSLISPRWVATGILVVVLVMLWLLVAQKKQVNVSVFANFVT
jgi:hypothetical protein